MRVALPDPSFFYNGRNVVGNLTTKSDRRGPRMIYECAKRPDELARAVPRGTSAVFACCSLDARSPNFLTFRVEGGRMF